MRRYKYSDDIVNAVKNFLEEEEWSYFFEEDSGLFRFNLKIRSRIQNISYVIDVLEDEFITYGMCPIGADNKDPEMMAQMAEFICRANYGLKNGCFELDFNDGEIRYRSYVDCENQLLSTAVVRNSVHCTASMFERYASGIVDIIFNKAAAKDVITKIETSKVEDLSSELEEACGGIASDDTIEELLTHLTSKLTAAIGGDDNPAEEDGQRGVCSKTSAEESGDCPEQPHIRMNLFAAEGGED